MFCKIHPISFETISLHVICLNILIDFLVLKKSVKESLYFWNKWLLKVQNKKTYTKNVQFSHIEHWSYFCRFVWRHNCFNLRVNYNDFFFLNKLLIRVQIVGNLKRSKTKRSKRANNGHCMLSKYCCRNKTNSSDSWQLVLRIVTFCFVSGNLNQMENEEKGKAQCFNNWTLTYKIHETMNFSNLFKLSLECGRISDVWFL